MTRSPALAEVLRNVLDARLLDVHIGLPARIERYDPVKQVVDVQPLIKGIYEGEEGERIAEQLPVIPNVPCQFPGGGGFRITFPVSQGDECFLVFSESSLDVWLSTGGVVDPLDERRFHLTDAVALLGVRSNPNALTEAPTDRMTIGLDGGVQINVDNSEIRLGANTGVDYVAIASKILTQLNSIRSVFNAHVHPETGTTTLITATPISAFGDMASNNVKAKT